MLVGQQVASYFDKAVGWLYAADRLYQLPLALVGGVVANQWATDAGADGTVTDRFIPDAERMHGFTPVYETLPGWQRELTDCTDRDDLPRFERLRSAWRERQLAIWRQSMAELARRLARAACAVGVSALFIETHQDPEAAPSDGPNMVPLDQMQPLIGQLSAYDALTKAAQNA